MFSFSSSRSLFSSLNAWLADLLIVSSYYICSQSSARPAFSDLSQTHCTLLLSEGLITPAAADIYSFLMSFGQEYCNPGNFSKLINLVN